MEDMLPEQLNKTVHVAYHFVWSEHDYELRVSPKKSAIEQIMLHVLQYVYARSTCHLYGYWQRIWGLFVKEKKWARNAFNSI